MLPLLRRPDLPGREMVQHALVRPWRFRPLAAGLALLAPGRFDIAERLAMLARGGGAVLARARPVDLRRPAPRRQAGGVRPAGQPGRPLHLAIAASCAVPGYFAPVRIEDHTYVDGGAHSPTNAAILRERALDLVVVVSPMSGPAALPTDLYGASRGHAARWPGARPGRCGRAAPR